MSDDICSLKPNFGNVSYSDDELESLDLVFFPIEEFILDLINSIKLSVSAKLFGSLDVLTSSSKFNEVKSCSGFFDTTKLMKFYLIF